MSPKSTFGHDGRRPSLKTPRSWEDSIGLPNRRLGDVRVALVHADLADVARIHGPVRPTFRVVDRQTPLPRQLLLICSPVPAPRFVIALKIARSPKVLTGFVEIVVHVVPLLWIQCHRMLLRYRSY